MTKTKKPPKPFHEIVYSATSFLARTIPPREWVLVGTIPHPGVGMWYAWRASGKTFTAMDFGLHVARGHNWMGYQCQQPRGVLYVDGEMPLADLHERLTKLVGPEGPPPNFFLLASEDLAVEHRNINLAHEADRRELAEAIDRASERAGVKIELVILDNWTTLVRGIDENDNSQMDPIKEWLILLRHGERSILVIHHAGKGGGQRGGSAREDILDYSAKLSKVRLGGPGSVFRLEWDKTRTGTPDPAILTMRLHEPEPGRLVLEPITASEPADAAETHGPEAMPRAHTADRILAALKEHGPMKHAALATAVGSPKPKVFQAALEKLLLDGRVKQYPNNEYGNVQ